jgi:hypothetical protein
MARHGWERIQSSRAVVNTFVCTAVICDQAQKVEIDTTDSKAGKSATAGMAERVGFEPTVGVNLHTLSKRAP